MPQGVAITVDPNPTAEADLLAAELVEVYERMGETTTFAIRLAVSSVDADLSWLADTRLSPGSTLVVKVPTKDGEQCLVKGPVTGQQVHLVQGGSGSWVDVFGADSSITMDRKTQAQGWAEVADSDVVTSILGNYGLVPDVSATDARATENTHGIVQRDTDLRFVRRLARRNGCLFWVTADPNGVQTAHFKRPPLDGTPGTALVINQEGANVQALDLRWDAERPTAFASAQLDLAGLAELDGTASRTPQTLLGAKGLQDITGDERTGLLVAPGDDGAAVRARAEGALIEADWFIQATGETTLAAYGGLLRAHTVVELKGAGSRHSGRYFVAGVRHLIDSTGHRMVFELVRNAWEA